MKLSIQLLCIVLLVCNCKDISNKKTTSNLPQKISSDSDSNPIEIEPVETQIQNQSDEEFIENSASTEISDKLNKINITLNDRLEITTKKQFDALLAFKDFLDNQEEQTHLDQLNNLLFVDIDDDGEEEVIFEYSVITFPETNTWGLKFFYGSFKNNTVTPIFNEFVGGKDWRSISLTTIDDDGLFWFDTLSYAEDDAMCCPSIKGVEKYSIIDGKFN